MYEEKYLVFVSGAQNSNKYYWMRPGNGSFTVEYGRVGKTPQTTTYPLSKFDAKYREKIAKGYQDQTALHLELQAPQAVTLEYAPIAQEKVRVFIEKLLSSAAQVLKRNYRISNTSVTAKMIADAERQLLHLRAIVRFCTLQQFNEELEQLFRIIPREMRYVSDYLAHSWNDIQQTLEREQDLLDIMSTKVKSNILLQQPKDTTKPANSMDILEAMGLTVSEVTEKEEAKLKKMLGMMASKYVSAYRVENPKTRKAFQEYHEKLGKEKKILQLWHGSRTENWWSIMNNGLLLRPQAVINGKMFGHGLYFANRAAKSAGYVSTYGSRWANGDARTGFLAVYDVLYGTPYKLDSSWSSSYSSMNYERFKQLHPESDCLHALKGKTGLQNDEIIVYKEEQATIKYVVEIAA